jgi:hypothetical protein
MVAPPMLTLIDLCEPGRQSLELRGEGSCDPRLPSGLNTTQHTTLPEAMITNELSQIAS